MNKNYIPRAYIEEISAMVLDFEQLAAKKIAERRSEDSQEQKNNQQRLMDRIFQNENDLYELEKKEEFNYLKKGLVQSVCSKFA